MKSIIPLSGLIVYSVILLLEMMQIIPDPSMSLQGLAVLYEQWSFLLMFLVIFVESIVYVGFYFPGQLFAVIIVLLNDFTWFNVIMLTIVSIVAVTIAAAINYKLGSLRRAEGKELKIRDLLIAMLHINLLALYVFQLGSSGGNKKVIWYAGILNIPYYIILIAVTFLIRDQIAIITEDTYFLFFLLCIWAVISVVVDIIDYHNLKKARHV